MFRERESIPYAFGGAKLRDEIRKRTTELDVVYAESGEETSQYVGEADGMIGIRMTADRLSRATKLRWLHMFSAGPDHFFKLSDVTADDFRRRGIVVTTSRGAASVVLAEQLLCYMLMFSRNMLRAVRQHLDGRWQAYPGGELCGGTVGIIGLGSIGARLAQLCKGLGMYVMATKRDPSRHGGVADEVLPASEYRQVMARADFLALTCPITEDTRRLINAETLRCMKPTAYLLNMSRGECIDEPALVEALKTGVIAGYAGDNHGYPTDAVDLGNLERLAPDSELWRLDNVIVTPNCAAVGPRRFEYMAEIIVDNYRRMKAGKEPATRLVWQGRVV
jgi:phosphoglycerate dehydrogenase-like enzyme